MAALEREGQRRRQEVDHQKRAEEKQQALETGRIGGIRVEVPLNEIPDHADGEHDVDEGRHERKKNLEDEDVGKSDPSQCPFTRENFFVLEDGLQDSER